MTVRYYSELGQDRFVLEILNNKRNGYFVEFGAMTGKEYSNTYVLEKEFNWQGIVSEPNPRFHEDLSHNRSCVIDNRAIFSSTGEILEFICRGHGYSGLADPGKSHNEETIKVESIALNDLLSQHGAPKYIDYISMDTEGSELQILEIFDFARYQVGIWTIEHNYQESRRTSIQDIMRNNGYAHVQVEKSRYDDWFVRQDLIK